MIDIEQPIISVEPVVPQLLIVDEGQVQVTIEEIAISLPSVADASMTVADPSPAITIGGSDEIAISVPAMAGEILVVGIQGPEGMPGSAAGRLHATANTALGGHRAVVAENGGASYADSSNLSHVGRVLGITTGAVTAGAVAEIAASGELVEPSWNWADGAVFLGTNGLLTQSPPTTGFIVSLGVAKAPHTLLVALGDPVILS